MSSKANDKIVDHLFRHQYGKMVAVLSRIFGLHHLELIEDAVQDTFLKAATSWRSHIPEQPEAWLTQAAKNRTIDLLRQINARKNRQDQIPHGSVALEIDDRFLETDIADSQLRMIFVACHPALAKEEQIAFALKAISGFSMKEIAGALLLKEETIKKRLVRARKKIADLNITLSFPEPKEISSRISGVLQIIYLIFNEGFHSTKPDQLISKDLCGEALRLCKLLLLKESFRTGSLYALFALMCFHSARLEAKQMGHDIIDLKHQDRGKWYLPLIVLGNDALEKSFSYSDRSLYHYEAAIASEHVRAVSFENTNWQHILGYYDEMYALSPSNQILLSKATIYLQINQSKAAQKTLNRIRPEELGQRKYLYHGCYAEYYGQVQEKENALKEFNLAISLCTNHLERVYLERKRDAIMGSSAD